MTRSQQEFTSRQWMCTAPITQPSCLAAAATPAPQLGELVLSQPKAGLLPVTLMPPDRTLGRVRSHPPPTSWTHPEQPSHPSAATLPAAPSPRHGHHQSLIILNFTPSARKMCISKKDRGGHGLPDPGAAAEPDPCRVGGSQTSSPAGLYPSARNSLTEGIG